MVEGDEIHIYIVDIVLCKHYVSILLLNEALWKSDAIQGLKTIEFVSWRDSFKSTSFDWFSVSFSIIKYGSKLFSFSFQNQMEGKRIISVDIGTSSIRSCLFDVNLKYLWSTSKPVVLNYSLENNTMLCEMDPEMIWNGFCDIIKDASK